MKKFASAFLVIIFSFLSLSAPLFIGTSSVWADDPPKDEASADGSAAEARPTCVDTAVLGDGEQFCANTPDGGVLKLLKQIIDVLTVGVGVVGVVGITIVGIQYMTAGGSEEKTRVAKRRIFEIVIGLVLYIFLYVLLRWLLPGFGV